MAGWKPRVELLLDKIDHSLTYHFFAVVILLVVPIAKQPISIDRHCLALFRLLN
jgi:hypothetical protein